LWFGLVRLEQLLGARQLVLIPLPLFLKKLGVLSLVLPHQSLQLPTLEFEVERKFVLRVALNPTPDRHEDVNRHVAADHVRPPGLVSGIISSVSSRYPLEKHHVQAQEAAAGE